MSFILDALNRSESERSAADSVPGLQTVHDAPQDTGNSLWQKILWPALAAVLAVVALVLWQGRAAPDAGPTEAVDNRTAAVAVAAAAPASVKAPAKAAEPSSAPVLDTGAAGTPAPEPISEPVSREQVTAEPAVDPDVAALYRRSETSAPVRSQVPAVPKRQRPARPVAQADAPSSAAQPPLDVEALTSAAADALAAHRAFSEPVVEHEAPFIGDLRQSLKDEIPSIFYSAHNWATNPAQRSVVLNGEVCRAGQQIKPGLKLVEILEDSIVLDFRGTEFRLRSLNSWVNL
jgi:hypothetical protein